MKGYHEYPPKFLLWIEFLAQPWSKEKVDFVMADIQWKVQDFELRLKSPYPLFFFYPTENPIFLRPEPQPEPDTNP